MTRSKRWGLLLAAWLACTAASGAPEPELAVQIGYRLDRELGAVDAAQRHALVARLLLARTRGELTPDASVGSVWLDWEARLERLERDAAIGRLPAWHRPGEPDAVDALVASVRADQAPITWSDPLWGDGQPAAGLRLLTDTGSPELAMALQPGVLAWARAHAPELWYRLLTWLDDEPEWLPLVAPLVAPWLAAPIDGTLATWRKLGDEAGNEIEELAGTDGRPGVIAINEAVDLLLDDSRAADRVLGRRSIDHEYRRFLAAPNDAVEQGLLSLARATQGIDSGRYAEFVTVFLGVLVEALERGATLPAEEITLALEKLDPILLPWLDTVDPRLINVFQRARQLLRQPVEGDESLVARRRELAALEAAVSLDTPILGSYLEQPVRESFTGELSVCFGLTRSSRGGPPRPLTRGQFDACVESMVAWAVESAGLPELAGQLSGPYEPENLVREIRLSPWQRINYWVGFMDRSVPASCGASTGELVNPLEWAIAARSLAWFIDRWPQYADPSITGAMAQVSSAGLRVLNGLAGLRRCLSPASPLLGGFDGYREALEELGVALDAAAEQFRAVRLEQGADVVLDEPVDQETSYRPTALVVRPCGDTPSCDMGAELEASKALFSRFPDPYLLADQVRLGRVELCYRDVSWEDRTAELPPVRTQAMARYSGRLSFVLEGRYSELPDPVFAMRLTSPDRYEYLFGENSPRVLDDPCPRHLLNQQVHAELPDRLVNLVPRRLTYMTADRMHPQRVFEMHWATGQEWRDWFVTGRGVELLSQQGAEPVSAAVTERLAALRAERDEALYQALLADDTSLLDGQQDPLVVAMRRLETRKGVLGALAKLLVPASVENDAGLRASLYGKSGLFDRSSVLRARQRGQNVRTIMATAEERLAASATAWRDHALGSVRVNGRDADRTVTTTLLQLRAVADRLAVGRGAAPDVDGDDQ